MVDHPRQQGEGGPGFFVVLGEYQVTENMKFLPAFVLLFWRLFSCSLHFMGVPILV